jgi:hypothetical protein
MSRNETQLTNKISPLIEGQVPDFIQADHPLFVTFLKHYYEFLEAAQIEVTVTVESIIQEKEIVEYVVSETDEKIILEKGAGSTGKFLNGETITGSTSKQTAKVLVEDSINGKLYTTSNQKFITGETIVGSTSDAQGVITSYRANPVQNIQQLLEYANVDNTIHDFLDNFRDQFMEVIPNTLASGASKRNLIKSIKDLYTAKGTSEGHKLFLRMLLDEEAEIIYPNKFMIKPSDGIWVFKTILRCEAGPGIEATEVIGKTITGETSTASAIAVSAITIQEGGDTIINFELDPDSVSGTFIHNETLRGVSSVTDRSLNFTCKGIIGTGPVTNPGILYSESELLSLPKPGGTFAHGNELAEVKVESIGTGTIDEIIVDAAGTGYQVGEVLTFSAQANTGSAEGFISSIGGGFALEDGTGAIESEDATYQYSYCYDIVLDGTDANGTDAGGSLLLDGGPEYDNILLETFSNQQKDDAFLELEEGIVAQRDITLNGTDGAGANADGAIQMETGSHGFFGIRDEFGLGGYHGDLLLEDETVGISNLPRGNQFLLESHTHTTDQNDKILSEVEVATNDLYGNNKDNLLLESHTFTDLGVESEATSIYKVSLRNGGSGYRSLPTVNVTTTNGSGHKLIASTSNIGTVQDIDMTNVGFNYSTVPEAVFRAHLILKNVTNNFTTSSNITTHNVEVKGYTGTYGVGAPASQVLSVLVTKPETITLDRTDLPNVDAGDDIILEDSLDGGYLVQEVYSQAEIFKAGTVISDDGGATGTIHKSDIALGSLIGQTVVTKSGAYDNFRSKLGEDTVRIQDSFYYQDFSYEVQVGEASINYMNELKRAVHPSGFLPFGKVSMATKVVAGIQLPAGKDVVDYTSDTDTFSPELASTFINLFTTVFGRRVGTPTDGLTIPSYDTRAAGTTSQFSNTTKELLVNTHKNIIINRTSEAQAVSFNFPTGRVNLARHPFGDEIGNGALATEAETNIPADIVRFDRNNVTFDSASTKFDVGESAVGTFILDGNISNFGNNVTGSNYVGDANERVILEDGADANEGSGPRISEIGTITFADLIDYDMILMEDATNPDLDTDEFIVQEDNSKFITEQQQFNNASTTVVPLTNYAKAKRNVSGNETGASPYMQAISTEILTRYSGRLKGSSTGAEDMHILLDDNNFIQLEEGSYTFVRNVL